MVFEMLLKRMVKRVRVTSRIYFVRATSSPEGRGLRSSTKIREDHEGSSWRRDASVVCWS